MVVSMAPDQTIDVRLSDRERERWQVGSPELCRTMQRQAIRAASAAGLTGTIHIRFPNGACVCTIRLQARYLISEDGVTKRPPDADA